MPGEAEENCYSGAGDILLHDQHLYHAASLSTPGHGQGRQAKCHVCFFRLPVSYNSFREKRTGEKD